MADACFNYTLDPDADVPVEIDWTTWLAGPDGDLPALIATSTWTADTGISLHDDETLTGDKITRTWLVSGELGVRKVRNRIVTDETPARTDERTIAVLVKER